MRLLTSIAPIGRWMDIIFYIVAHGGANDGRKQYLVEKMLTCIHMFQMESNSIDCSLYKEKGPYTNTNCIQ
jgi:hypothetical protein